MDVGVPFDGTQSSPVRMQGERLAAIVITVSLVAIVTATNKFRASQDVSLHRLARLPPTCFAQFTNSFRRDVCASFPFILLVADIVTKPRIAFGVPALLYCGLPDVLLCVCAGDGCNQNCDCAAGNKPEDCFRSLALTIHAHNLGSVEITATSFTHS